MFRNCEYERLFSSQYMNTSLPIDKQVWTNLPEEIIFDGNDSSKIQWKVFLNDPSLDSQSIKLKVLLVV